jgi:hypothetical protein
VNRLLIPLTIIYLSLPIILFNATWINSYWGLPTIGVHLLVLSYLVKQDYQLKLVIPLSSILLLLGIAALFAIYTGIGGLTGQHGDLVAHNGKYFTLVKNDWPIKNQGGPGTYLCYFLGYYLVPAFLSKIFPDLFFVFYILWNFIGIYFMLLWLYFTLNNNLIKVLIFFMFGGLSQFFICNSNNLFHTDFTYYFSFLQNSLLQQLLIVPNQLPAVTICICFFMFLIRTNNRIEFAAYSIACLLYWAIMPSIWLIIIYIFVEISFIITKRTIIRVNTVLIYFLVLLGFTTILLYFSNNNNELELILKQINGPKQFLKVYIFQLLEYTSIALIFLFLASKRDFSNLQKKYIIVYAVVLGVLLVFNTLKLGKNNDLYVRGLMVAYIFFSLQLCLLLDKFKETRLLKKLFIACYFGIHIYMFSLFFYLKLSEFYNVSFLQNSKNYNLGKYDNPNIYQVMAKNYSKKDADQYFSKNKFVYSQLLK